jgi:hypothetical protein
LYTCPVCALPGLSAKPYAVWPPPVGLELCPPYSAVLGSPSLEICPRCLFQPGFDDDPGATHDFMPFEAYRAIWEAEGRIWRGFGWRPAPGDISPAVFEFREVEAQSDLSRVVAETGGDPAATGFVVITLHFTGGVAVVEGLEVPGVAAGKVAEALLHGCWGGASPVEQTSTHQWTVGRYELLGTDGRSQTLFIAVSMNKAFWSIDPDPETLFEALTRLS